MLTPDQIEQLGNKAQVLLDPVQSFLLEEIARRIREAGELTSTAEYQVWRLQNLGNSQKAIKKEVAKLLKVSEKQLEKLIREGGKDGYKVDLSSLPHDRAIPFEENTAIQNIISAAVNMAQDDLLNITQTIGFCMDADGKKVLPLTQAYQKACDNAFMQVSTGATDFQTAVRAATKGLAERGIQYIDYDSGVHTSLEAATRRSVMGGMGIMQMEMSQRVHDDFGCDGWELSAHAASAPDHEPYQGKQYTDAEYKKLNAHLKREIGTLNCGHSAHPIVMGVSKPQYTAAELKRFQADNEAGVEVNEKHYTTYQATQKQRAIERAMRKQKKRILVAQAINDPDLPQLKTRMQVLRQAYNRFSEDAGLRTQIQRTYVTVKGAKY